jgi:hypothetical protein
MKTLFLVVFLVAAGISTASANPFALAHRLGGGGTIVVPPEWAGIWQSTDSTYDCNGVLQSVSSGLDTLCAGTRFEQDTTFTCTGSTSSTTYQQHCTGSEPLFPDCQFNFDLEVHGTRSGDSFFSVAVFQSSTSGTAEGCNLFPPSCNQVNTHSTRIGPAPAEYCATPVRSSSWGQIKSRYR